jgi:type IV secretion system protein VirD4
MKFPTWAKVLFVLAAVAAGIVVAMYVAGFVFLAANKTNPFNASLATIYQYWYYYRDDPEQKGHFKAAFTVAALIGAAVPIGAVIGMLKGGRALHGDARFATKAEVQKAGLFGNTGIIVGRAFGKFLILGGQLFAALAAPTRSGKGVSIVIPNLLNFPDSCVVNDIKLENYEITSKYRALYGQEVFLFCPFAEDGKTHRWNPLSYINPSTHYRVSDILGIGYVLYPEGGQDSFFNDQARNLFMGLVLFLMETPELPLTISEALRQSSGKGKPIKKYLTDLMAERDQSDRPLSDSCVEALLRFTSNSDNTMASILASFNAPLTIWANPIVDAATSGNDFWLTDLRKKRMTIYLGVTPDKLPQARLIMNLFFSQIINLNTKELPSKNPELKYQVLLMPDEFTALGKVDIINKAVSYMAGYGLRLMPIFQSMSQLASVYGDNDARTMMTNHACQIIFPPREQKDANEYSEMLGYMTEKSTSTSVNNKGAPLLALSGSSRGESTSDQKRALLLPQELKELGQDKEIVILENIKPILAEKVRYYQEPIFMDRLKEVSPSLAKIVGLPSREQLEAAINAGELAAPVPVVDLDLHVAMVESRTRFLTENDLAEGEGDEDKFDLAALAHDFTDLPELDDQENPSEEAVTALVSGFFAKLEDRTAPVEEDVLSDLFEVPSGMQEHVDEDGVVTFAPPVSALGNSDEDGGFDLSVLDGGDTFGESGGGIEQVIAGDDGPEFDLSALDHDA